MKITGHGRERPGESGFPIHDWYGADDDELAPPGTYPYVRGIAPEADEDQPWVMAQYSGFAGATEAAERIRWLLDHGQTGVYLALDLPSQMGYDPDHPLADGEVGKVGVSLASVADVEALLSLVDPRDVRMIRTTANGTGPIVLAMFVAYARRQGLDTSTFRVRLQNDVLKEYVARGTYIVPPRHGLRLAGDVIEYCARHLPGWGGLSVAGPHMRNAGASPAQELGFVMSHAVAYFSEIQRRGVDVASAARVCDVLMCAQMSFFEEIGKFRAARRLWATTLHDRFDVDDDEALKLRLNLFTSGFPLTAQQPLNNVVRVAVEALALVLGGAEVMGTTSYDEALGIPTERAATLALRTQQILAHETRLAAPVDPLGGSYYVEYLTDQVEDAARAVMDAIENQGGAVAAIEAGYPQQVIADGAYRWQRQVESGERVIVGVNRYREEETVDEPLFQVDESAQRDAVDRIQALRAGRDSRRVAAALDDVRSQARSEVNLVPALVEAMDADATVGEAAAVLRDEYGAFRGSAVF